MKNFSGRRIAGRMLVISAATVGISAAVAQIVDLPEAPGKELVLGACVDCHGADNIVKTRRSSDEWTAVVEKMVDYGAALSAEEQVLVVAYLNTHLGNAAGSPAAPAPRVSPPVPAPASDTPSPKAPVADPAAEPENVSGTPK